MVLTAPSLLSSCKAFFYTPNRNPVPLFKNAGDVYIDASTNLIRKYDITAGYAIVDGLGAYAGYSGARLRNTTNDTFNGVANATKEQYNGEMLNLGLGYFLSQKNSENFRFEIFGDLAMGSYKNKVSGTRNEFFNGNYTRIGIMPNFGYSSSDNRFNFAYSIRLSNITFSDPSLSDINYWRVDYDRLHNKESYNLIEHGLTMRAGSEFIKFQAQMAFYHCMDSQEDLNAVPFFNASIMFGVVINTNVLSNR
jgi:hypothetical protein